MEREEQGVSRRVKRESCREREVGQVKVVRKVPTKRERESARVSKSTLVGGYVWPMRLHNSNSTVCAIGQHHKRTCSFSMLQ